MSRCPYLESESTGWFSGNWICKLTGAKVGDLNHDNKVNNVCNNDDYDAYKDCRTYDNR